MFAHEGHGIAEGDEVDRSLLVRFPQVDAATDFPGRPEEHQPLMGTA